VRLAVCIATLVGLAAPAVACPPLDACLVRLRSTIREPRQPATPALESVTRSLQLPLTAVKRGSGEFEMPWIWRVLRDQVYSRMPSYQDRNELKVVLAPVVVTSSSDTIPGVGIAGAF